MSFKKKLIMTISILASAGYVHANIPTNVRPALNAANIVISSFQWLGMYLGYRFRMK